MATDTKPNLISSKFEQCVGDILNLSGCTQIYGTFNVRPQGSIDSCSGYKISGNTILNTSPGSVTSVRLGQGAGVNNNSGICNVFIGYNAGCGSTGSNRLYIGNTAACTLIYGDFTGNTVTLPTLKLCTTPSSGSCDDSLLVWNSTDKIVKKLPYSAGISTANNGLNVIGTNVRLGGTLTGNTCICGAHTLGFSNSYVNITGNSGVNIGGVIRLVSTPSAGTTSDSLLIWNSSDKCLKTLSISCMALSANNGLTKSGTNVRLGGSLTGNTAITGAYTLSVCSGALLNTDKGYQVSGSTVLRTTPNSNTNILVGVYAGNNTMTGVDNSAMGACTLLSNTTGCQNSAMGVSALRFNTTGCQNSAMGVSALNSNTTGCQNSAMGYAALFCNTSGNTNSAVGYQALNTNTTGSYNSAIGSSALLSNTTGCQNSAMGVSALRFNTTGCQNSAMGVSALRFNTTGSYNSAMGVCALQCNTTGSYNSAMGVCALQCNTTGCFNTAMGYFALYSNTTGSQNSAMGVFALNSNTTGCQNSAMGYAALFCNTSGNTNSAVGYQALNTNTTGSYNSAMGACTLYTNTTGSYNSAMGACTLLSNTTGCQNSAMGYFALYTNTTGCQNSAMGVSALRFNTTGCQNSAMGVGALRSNTTGCLNSAMGACALYTNTTGCNNSAMGYAAGYSNSTGCLNVFIGTCAGYNETGSGKLYIATGATKSLVYGDFSTNEITLPKLLLCETPSDGNSNNSILVWDSNSCCVKKVAYISEICANNGLTKSGTNVRLGGTLTGNTAISGAYTLGFNNTYVNITGSSGVNLSGVIKLLSTPAIGLCSDSVLVWNSTDKCVKQVPYFSGSTGGGATVDDSAPSGTVGKLWFQPTQGSLMVYAGGAWVNANRNGIDGKGWTGGSYNASTGVVTFGSSDGLGFSTGDLRASLTDDSVTYAKLGTGFKNAITDNDGAFDFSAAGIITANISGTTTISFTNLQRNKTLKVKLVITNSATINFPSYAVKLAGSQTLGNGTFYLYFDCWESTGGSELVLYSIMKAA